MPKNSNRNLAGGEMPKVCVELFALTYGSCVMQLIKDYGDLNTVNDELMKMGYIINILIKIFSYNIGTRIIEEYLSRTPLQPCKDFQTTVETVGTTAFNLFLGTTASEADWNEEKTECNLVLQNNPFALFNEIPEEYHDLKYSNLLCGVIKGALEMVNVYILFIYYLI